MQRKHCDIKIVGRVQGVGFRAATKRYANILGIVGFVRNLEDGSVYVEAEGVEKDLNKFVEQCKKGSLLSKVTQINVTEGALMNFQDFSIR